MPLALAALAYTSFIMVNPPPQSPYYSNYSTNPVSPKNASDRLPDVPEQPNGTPPPSAPPAKEQRLIVVSNRLPVTISKDKNGEYTFSMSSGGLVSALSGTKKKMSFTWIGWPGKHVSGQEAVHMKVNESVTLTEQIPEADREHVNKRLLDEYSCYPVYLSDELADRHYNGEYKAQPLSILRLLRQASPTPSSGHCSTTTPER